MRGSVCAYWLRLGLLLVCRSLRLSVAGWLGVCCLRCFASLPSPDGFPDGVGVDRMVGPTVAPIGVDSPMVERLWAVAGWISRLFTGSSAWASVCVCVLWRRMDFRAVDACAHGCPWTLAWLRGACVVRACLSCARSCCVCACGLMCVPGGPFCGSSHRGAAPPEVVFRPPTARGSRRHRPST